MDIGEIRRPKKKLIEGFRGLATSTIGNMLDDMKISGVIQNINPISLGFRLVGGAVAVKEITGVLGTYTNEDFKLGGVIDSTQARGGRR